MLISLVYIFSIPLENLVTLFRCLLVLFILFRGSKNECTWHHKNVRFHNVLSVAEQELCLNIIPTFANLIDYPSMKNSLVPRIKSACLQTSSLAVSLHHFCSQLVPLRLSASVVIHFRCLCCPYPSTTLSYSFKMLPLHMYFDFVYVRIFLLFLCRYE